ncbi:hypothetical protein BM221_007878 [Beauveria bassiana]|uniref:Extracellular matrix protein n=1 Tax=Beauveria bassiana TaxID=176275 RepID=A0A2N6NEI9_BEABA|nr:hypothetical protein BM221_007878 [Beauveria bassiana]
MKSTAATIAAVVATCAFAQPEFTNSEINPQEGQPFTLRFNGCDNGCTISLQTGPSPMSLSDIHTLTTDATGGSFDVTLSGLDTGIYNFKIADNSDGSCNYSIPFFYVGAKVTSSDSSGGPSTTHVYDASSTSRLSDSACCSNPDSTASKDVSPTALVSSTHSSRESFWKLLTLLRLLTSPQKQAAPGMLKLAALYLTKLVPPLAFLPLAP